jgi:glycogen operon protein
MRPETKEGQSSPLGATPYPDGANFSVYSKHATAVDLLLFDSVDDARPARVIRIDPPNRTYHYWHVFVPAVKAGQIYGYRVEGPFDPQNGMRFDPAKVLLDPYGRGIVVPNNYSREAASMKGDNAAAAMKSGGDGRVLTIGKEIRRSTTFRRTIIYEMHVRGFTAIQFRRRCTKTRHVCGSDRERSLPAETRRRQSN